MLEGVMEQVTSREHQRPAGHTTSLQWRREEERPEDDGGEENGCRSSLPTLPRKD